MGALPDGRYSDLSEWPRSVCDAGAPSPRRTQGTATGIVRRVDAGVIITPMVYIAKAERKSLRFIFFAKISWG